MDMFAVVRQRPDYVYSRGERQLIRQIGVVGGCLRTDMSIVVSEISVNEQNIRREGKCPLYRYVYSRVGRYQITDTPIVVMRIPYDVMQIDFTQRRVVIAFKESLPLIKTQKYVQGIHFEASGSTHTTLC